MANHKRRRAKNRRAGCTFCKPHKANGTSRAKAMKPSDRRRAGPPRRDGSRDV